MVRYSLSAAGLVEPEGQKEEGWLNLSSKKTTQSEKDIFKESASR
jgi:hypothetical protein